jgi:hypothetical protein
VISEESGVRKEEWSGFGGEWSAKCRVEWFRRGSINVEWSVIGEVGSCTAPYRLPNICLDLASLSYCLNNLEIPAMPIMSMNSF